MQSKRILLVLGGTYHDFEGFAHAMRALLEPAGYTVEATYDLERLTRLREDGCDLVLSYTCFARHDDAVGSSAPAGLTEAQLAGLTGWVRGGGALLAAHASTVSGESGPGLRALLGGEFVSHPDAFAFTVYPLYRAHPITAGLEAFTVHDELYIQDCDPAVEIHMIVLDRGVAYPVVWSKSEGQGRVAHVALGHDGRVWDQEPYQRLMRQTVNWLLE